MTTKLNLTREQQEARRLLAGQMLQQGQGVREVARSLEVAPSSVSRWKKAFEKGSFEALKAKKHPGAKPRLNARQKQRLIRILAKGPVKAGYRNDLWTCPRVAELIERTFGIHYHPGHVWYLLRDLAWSCQLPEQQSREGDQLEQERWRKRKWPQIKGGPAAS